MDIYTIYRATNIITSKVYIGFDARWPKRKSEHKTASKNQQYKIYNAIRKYGWNNFVWEPIYQSTDYNHCLNRMEQYFIDEYDSIRNGYNSTKGGAGGSAGASWWNDGLSQILAHLPPNNTFIKGRLNYINIGGLVGAEAQRGKIWINNGSHQMMIPKIDIMPEGYALGRTESKKKGKPNISASGSRWWNNGIDQKMVKDCPGPGWKLGRCRGGGYGAR
jgi:hypothetical protein